MSAVPDRDLSDRASGLLRQQAMENLTYRLRDGKTVGKFNFRDLLDCEINSNRYRLLLDELDTLLCGEGGNDTRDGFADRMVEGIIERFLNDPKQDDLIEEEAAEIEAEREET